MSARSRVVERATELSLECSAAMNAAEKARFAPHDWRNDPGRGKEVWALACHARALGLLEAVTILDEGEEP